MKKLNQQKSFEDLRLLLASKAANGYEIKEVIDSGDVMGGLMGFQFDSDHQGGYIYFWSTGLVGRQLMHYGTGEELIEDATSEMSDEEVVDLLNELELKL